MYLGYFEIRIRKSDLIAKAASVGKQFDLTNVETNEENRKIVIGLGQPVTVRDTEGERWLQWSVDICSAELEKCLDFAAMLSERLKDLCIRCHWYLSSGNIVSGNMELVNGKETMFEDLGGPIENKNGGTEMRKTIIFNDSVSQGVSAYTLTWKDTETYPDAATLFKAVSDAAEKEGLYDTPLWDIPASLYARFGAKLQPAKNIEIVDWPRTGSNTVFSLCKCMDCEHYENGNCWHYGGSVDGYDTGCSRMSCPDSVQLSYETEEDETIIYIPFFVKDLNPVDAVKYVMDHTDNHDLDYLRDEIKEIIEDAGSDYNEKAWKFVNY